MIVTAGTIITDKERQYVADAVENLSHPTKFNEYILRFEKAFAEYVGARYALTTTNGTAALHLGLLAMGIGKGDEVILPDMTYIAGANAISYTGATPIFADIEPTTWCINAKDVKEKINRHTKAIMPVWTYGNMSDMGALKSLGIPIIEDSCPAIGSKWWTHHAGTIGKVGAFSFQGAKLLAIGEGGMLVTDDEDIYKKAQSFGYHGITDKQFVHDRIGYKYKMSNIQAAVGLAQLEHIDEMIEKKRYIFNLYKERLGDLYPMNVTGPGVFSNMWMPSIICEQRDELREYLKEHDIDTRPFFYPQTSFGIYNKWKNPVSYEIASKGINLPSAVYLSYSEIEYVYNTITAFAKAH